MEIFLTHIMLCYTVMFITCLSLGGNTEIGFRKLCTLSSGSSSHGLNSFITFLKAFLFSYSLDFLVQGFLQFLPLSECLDMLCFFPEVLPSFESFDSKLTNLEAEIFQQIGMNFYFCHEFATDVHVIVVLVVCLLNGMST